MEIQEKENLKPKRNLEVQSTITEMKIHQTDSKVDLQAEKISEFEDRAIEITESGGTEREEFTEKSEQSLKRLLRYHSVDQHMHRHMKRCSVLLISREIQMQNNEIPYLTPIRMATIKTK